MSKKVILLHGFNRTSQDMQALQKNLSILGYEGILVDLPLTFHRIERGVSLLDDYLGNMLANLPPQEKIHLVGHSTGGLVIRRWLATSKYSCKVDRCVLIATPNRGSELADLADKYAKFLPLVCKTLQSLQSRNVKELPALSKLPVELGAIAGNRNNLFLGLFLKGENDGRVTVESVRIAGLKDFLVLPLGHLEIHKDFSTAQFVDHFLKTGCFK